MLERRTAETRKGKINYLDSMTGQKIVFYIHGGFGGPDAIETLISYLSGYRLIAPYLPGHGSFEIDDEFNYLDLKNSLQDFLMGIQGDKILVGHSLGGRLAWDLAGNKDVAGTILLAPMVRAVNTRFINMALNVARDFGKDIGMRGLQGTTGENGGGLARVKSLARIWTVIAELKAAEEKKKNTPTLLMWGKNDHALPPVEKFAGLETEFFPGGHYWFLNPGLHWKMINEFCVANFEEKS